MKTLLKKLWNQSSREELESQAEQELREYVSAGRESQVAVSPAAGSVTTEENPDQDPHKSVR
ncbi:MAG: hypothetical protein ACREJP_11215 [Candidatus Methylomirabilales bacterium]